MKVKDGALKMR